MADYKLYDSENYSVLIDPKTNEDESFNEYQKAFTYSQQNPSYMVIKDSIPPTIRKNIEDHLGKIEYSNERIKDQGHYVIVKDKIHGSYDALQIDAGDGGYHIGVKSGFPDYKQAYEYIERAQTNEQNLSEYQRQKNISPQHNDLSELQVVESPTSGYYVGRNQYDADLGQWMPYTRVSGMMPTFQQADKVLQTALEFEKDIAPINKGNLRVLAESFSEDLTPENILKRNIVNERAALYPEKQLDSPELSR